MAEYYVAPYVYRNRVRLKATRYTKRYLLQFPRYLPGTASTCLHLKGTASRALRPSPQSMEVRSTTSWAVSLPDDKSVANIGRLTFS